jgi:hypothetical protein
MIWSFRAMISIVRRRYGTWTSVWNTVGELLHHLTISHHTPPLQNKVRRLYFIFCKFYVAAGAVEIEPFIPTNYSTTTRIK